MTDGLARRPPLRHLCHLGAASWRCSDSPRCRAGAYRGYRACLSLWRSCCALRRPLAARVLPHALPRTSRASAWWCGHRCRSRCTRHKQNNAQLYAASARLTRLTPFGIAFRAYLSLFAAYILTYLSSLCGALSRLAIALSRQTRRRGGVTAAHRRQVRALSLRKRLGKSLVFSNAALAQSLRLAPAAARSNKRSAALTRFCRHNWQDLLYISLR